MINPQDFYAQLFHATDSDIGQGWEQKLSGSLLTSHTATMRPLFQGLDGGVHFAQGRLAVLWMVVPEVIANVGCWMLGYRCWGKTRESRMRAL